MKKWILSLAVAALFAGQSNAAMITYTQTGGTLTGSLNGVDFTDAAFTITATGDTADIVDYNVLGAFPAHLLSVPVIINIAGVGSATFSDPVFGASAIDFSVASPGAGIVGFGDSSGRGFGILTNMPEYDLSTPATFGPSSTGANDGDYDTSAGTLTVVSASGDSTFTASAAGAVPEPSSVVMMGIAGLAGLGVAIRRRSA